MIAAGRQLELFLDEKLPEKLDEESRNAGSIASYLSSRCARPVKVVFTDNTSTMITVHQSPACSVRLHRMFACAPSKVLSALAVYVKWPRHRASNAALSRYIKEKSHLIKPAHTRGRRIITRGRYFDLKDVFEKLNREYFDGKVTAMITWGRPFRGRRRRSIRFGCVDREAGVVRINPSLDAPFVPGFFLEYIVYHEMLHCLVGAQFSADGRELAHHRAFREREKQYARYHDALRWQNENFHRFLGKRGT